MFQKRDDTIEKMLPLLRPPSRSSRYANGHHIKVAAKRLFIVKTLHSCWIVLPTVSFRKPPDK